MSIGDCAEMIREEIFRGGPVTTMLEVSPGFSAWQSGVLGEEAIGLAANATTKFGIYGPWVEKAVLDVADFVVDKAATCPDPKRYCFHFEKIGHSVILAGWGEEEHDGKIIPYWIVQNTWGEKYFDGGFLKIVRGLNQFGIETAAVTVVPALNKNEPSPLLSSRFLRLAKKQEPKRPEVQRLHAAVLGRMFEPKVVSAGRTDKPIAFDTNKTGKGRGTYVKIINKIKLNRTLNRKLNESPVYSC